MSRGGFYDYPRRQQRAPDPDREEKLAWIKELAAGSDHTYVSRRMAEGLRARCYAVGRYQARRLMRNVN